MIYPNLSAEMARKNISRKDIASILEVNVCTMTSKLNNVKSIKLFEAQRIQEELFNDIEFSYLFETCPVSDFKAG